MNNVKSVEYLLGVSIIILVMSIFSTCLYLPIIDIGMENLGKFLITMSLGSICSILLGTISETFIDCVANASFTLSPISLVLSVIPMLAPYNEYINNLSKIVYSDRISNMISSFETGFTFESIAVIIANIIILFIIFQIIYKKRGLSVEE